MEASSVQTYYLDATWDVILAGGIFDSPQTLILSSIGPKETLEKFDMPCISKLPSVGQNIIDQPIVTSAHRVNLINSTLLLKDPAYTAKQGEEYLIKRTSVFTDAGMFAGFKKIPENLRQNFSSETIAALAKFPSDWPEVEHIAVQALQAEFSNSFLVDPMDGYNYASITTIFTPPLSRGSLTLQSADPHVHPLIDSCWLCDPGDIEVALAAFKREREIWDVPSFSNLSIGPEYWPGVGNSTDEQILEAIHNSVRTIYDAAGTCKSTYADGQKS
jgi:choline dehydrogenase